MSEASEFQIIYQKIKLANQLRIRTPSDLTRARSICGEILEKYPDHFGALFLNGVMDMEEGKFKSALPYLLMAAAINPDNWAVLIGCANSLLQIKSYKMAKNYFQLALNIKNDDVDTIINYAECLRKLGEISEALAEFTKVQNLDPSNGNALLGRARCLAEVGNETAALAVLESMIQKNIIKDIAISELASLNQSISKDAIIQYTPSLISKKSHHDIKSEPKDLNYVPFIEAQRLHFLGQFEAAWHKLIDANEPIFRNLESEYLKLKETQDNVLTLAKSPSKFPELKYENPQLTKLFIMGPSRSGKTSLEKLLSVSNQVQIGSESFIVENAVKRTLIEKGMLPSSLLEVLPYELHKEFLTIYNDCIKSVIGERKIITNTNPSRILDMNRLLSIDNTAKLIIVTRNYDDLAIRIFMKKYLTANSYAYNIETIYTHIKWYSDMMLALTKKFPDRILMVSYENIINKTNEVISSIEDFCDIRISEKNSVLIQSDVGVSEPYKKYLRAI